MNEQLNEQLDLFAELDEYQQWLRSPPGTMALWVVRERTARKGVDRNANRR